MGKPGPKPKVSDDRLLVEVLLAETNAVFASQIADRVDMDTVQGVRDRLNEICEDTEFLSKKEVSGRNLYSLTDEGREYLQAEIRNIIE